MMKVMTSNQVLMHNEFGPGFDDKWGRMSRAQRYRAQMRVARKWGGDFL